MSNNAPLGPEERLEIVEALRRGNLSHHEIATRFNRAQSTVSKIARDAGITPTHRRKRSPAAKDVESTYGKAERVEFADRFISVLQDMVQSGGLSPRDVREVAQASKVLLDARRNEDYEPGHESTESGGQMTVDRSAGLSAINLEEMFGRLDREQEALDADREEGEER
jgi:transposase-like protein